MSLERSSELAPEDLTLGGLSLEPSVEPELQPLPDPLIVTFNIGAHIPYNVPGLTLHGRAHEVRAELRADSGAVAFKSSPFDLGNVHFLRDKVLFGTLSFTYTYDAKERTITVCSTDYASSAGMALTTTPEGTESFCIERASGAGFAEDDISSDRLWSYRTPLTPGAEATFKNIVRGANDALLEALMDVPGLNVTQRKPFRELPRKLFFDLTTVWRDDTAVGTYDPAVPLEPRSFLMPPSTFHDVKTWYPGQKFCNVFGSTNDPKIDKLSWIGLWKEKTGITTPVCSSPGFPAGVACKGIILGGHVMEGWGDGEPKIGGNEVRIIPICSRHNQLPKDNNKMQITANTQVVRLNNYFK
jgi:hypothetical protein